MVSSWSLNHTNKKPSLSLLKSRLHRRTLKMLHVGWADAHDWSNLSARFLKLLVMAIQARDARLRTSKEIVPHVQGQRATLIIKLALIFMAAKCFPDHWDAPKPDLYIPTIKLSWSPSFLPTFMIPRMFPDFHGRLTFLSTWSPGCPETRSSGLEIHGGFYRPSNSLTSDRHQQLQKHRVES